MVGQRGESGPQIDYLYKLSQQPLEKTSRFDTRRIPTEKIDCAYRSITHFLTLNQLNAILCAVNPRRIHARYSTNLNVDIHGGYNTHSSSDRVYGRTGYYDFYRTPVSFSSGTVPKVRLGLQIRAAMGHEYTLRGFPYVISTNGRGLLNELLQHNGLQITNYDDIHPSDTDAVLIHELYHYTQFLVYQLLNVSVFNSFKFRGVHDNHKEDRLFFLIEGITHFLTLCTYAASHQDLAGVFLMTYPHETYFISQLFDSVLHSESKTKALLKDLIRYYLVPRQSRFAEYCTMNASNLSLLIPTQHVRLQSIKAHTCIKDTCGDDYTRLGTIDQRVLREYMLHITSVNTVRAITDILNA